MVQISHPYMTTRKTIALARWTFVGKVISLLFNILSGFVIAFLPRSKHLFQHHSSKASILCCSAFLMVQLSHPYMTTGKTIALIIWTFVGKVMFLLFNMSRFIIAFKGVSVFEFHGCSHCPQWFWSLVVWRQIYKKIKCHCFNFSSFYLPWIDGTRCYDLSFLNIEF